MHDLKNMKIPGVIGKLLRVDTTVITYFTMKGLILLRDAIRREKEVKKWNRMKKESLINSLNTEWSFLNDNEIFDHGV